MKDIRLMIVVNDIGYHKVGIITHFQMEFDDEREGIVAYVHMKAPDNPNDTFKITDESKNYRYYRAINNAYYMLQNDEKYKDYNTICFYPESKLLSVLGPKPEQTEYIYINKEE